MSTDSEREAFVLWADSVGYPTTTWPGSITFKNAQTLIAQGAFISGWEASRRADRALRPSGEPDCSGDPNSCPNNEGFGCACSSGRASIEPSGAANRQLFVLDAKGRPASWVPELSEFVIAIQNEARYVSVGWVEEHRLEALAEEGWAAVELNKAKRWNDDVQLYKLSVPSASESRTDAPTESQERNQCDGCAVSAPLTSMGDHRYSDGSLIACTKDRYEQQPTESQLRALQSLSNSTQELEALDALEAAFESEIELIAPDQRAPFYAFWDDMKKRANSVECSGERPAASGEA